VAVWAGVYVGAQRKGFDVAALDDRRVADVMLRDNVTSD
jgi:hypothetical protein